MSDVVVVEVEKENPRRTTPIPDDRTLWFYRESWNRLKSELVRKGRGLITSEINSKLVKGFEWYLIVYKNSQVKPIHVCRDYEEISLS